MQHYPHKPRKSFCMALAICVITIALALMPHHTLAADATADDVTTDPARHFLKMQDVADAVLLLSAPPEPGSAAFQHDEAMYRLGMTMRKSPEGERAAEDAEETTAQRIMSFSMAFGHPISKEETPAIFGLLRKVMGDAGSLATYTAKQAHARIRPFAYYGTSTCKPSAESSVNPQRSFPSGHSAMGWAVALVLSEINPERQNQILQRGLNMGRGRVICGYHWQSDVDAGRIVGATTVARLHANEAFARELAVAKAEFASLQKTTGKKD